MRSASCLAAFGSCDTRGAKRVFWHARVAPKNDQDHLPPVGGKCGKLRRLMRLQRHAQDVQHILLAERHEAVCKAAVRGLFRHDVKVCVVDAQLAQMRGHAD